MQVYKNYIELNGGFVFLVAIIFCMTAWAALSVYANLQI
jgi:hypothetical protein